MSDGVPLLLPFAVRSAPDCREALRALALPNLSRLLARLRAGPADEGDETSLSPPHERALARALGLPVQDGLIPWAALAARRAGLQGEAWAWITPCHWRVGADHIAMALPQDVPLADDESQAIFEAVQPYFAEDGLELVRHAPQRWLARGEALAGLPTASLDRVAGRDIDAWVPRAAAARPLRRLQQEMQMLLYTHPVTDARQARGALPVNSFWISGTGALPAGSPVPAEDTVRVIDTLHEPALRQDWPAWQRAWQQVDDEVMRPALDALAQGRPVQLTLCGDRSARTWSSAGVGLWQRAASLVRTVPAAAMMESL